MNVVMSSSLTALILLLVPGVYELTEPPIDLCL